MSYCCWELRSLRRKDRATDERKSAPIKNCAFGCSSVAFIKTNSFGDNFPLKDEAYGIAGIYMEVQEHFAMVFQKPFIKTLWKWSLLLMTFYTVEKMN